MRDSQRKAVYAWEEKVAELADGANRPITLDECHDLVVRVWGDYFPGLDPPEVVDGRGRRSPCGSRERIALPRFARRPIVVLHEVAHSFDPEGPAHGPCFARLALELYSRYAGVSKAQAKSLGVHQKPRRVRFASPSDVPSPPSQEWKAWHVRKAELIQNLREHARREPGRSGEKEGEDVHVLVLWD